MAEKIKNIMLGLPADSAPNRPAIISEPLILFIGLDSGVPGPKLTLNLSEYVDQSPEIMAKALENMATELRKYCY